MGRRGKGKATQGLEFTRPKITSRSIKGDQSNGDNFHAEVVGVTVAAMAAVEANSCIIYTDSLATINAVKAQRTDRAWVRTPSRDG